MIQTKSALRQYYLHQRRKLSLTQATRAATRIANLITDIPWLHPLSHFACYAAIKNELTLHTLMTCLWQQGKTLYLPILHPWRSTLWFTPYTAHSQVTVNRFGIQEPVYEAHTLTAPWELDVIFVPLVAFDRHGHRLGMGQGYYDRSLAFARTSKPYLIGIAYACQEAEHLPHEEHDIKLDAIMTERELIMTNALLYDNLKPRSNVQY